MQQIKREEIKKERQFGRAEEGLVFFFFKSIGVSLKKKERIKGSMGWHVCYTALLKDDFCLFVFIVLFKFSWFHVCTCDGNFGGPVGRAFQHRQLSLFYGVYVGVGIHIKYHAVDNMAFGIKREFARTLKKRGTLR